ncbi:addiction module protein [Nitrosospira briensis]|uniref:addiction module protein n=1 Tax=Nitrosospira briensis TaxID=35799 RepID=UPI0008E4D7DC|nr:addiction module protein [Nitrosospira briensis]SFN67615.1 putative addiction module component, TIGR02574 family [Nitrosospira briensis]
MKMLTKEDVRALTADQKLELMDLLSESLEEDNIPVSPEVRDEVESRLTTFDEDKETALPWRDALRQLAP